jgi:hypothetical protein
MIKHYELEPHDARFTTALVFDWDEEAGTVSGRDADRIIELVRLGGTMCHPYIWDCEFSKFPLKSKTDMAAIIGWKHKLPEDLIDYYPQLIEEPVLDEDGNVIPEDRLMR